MKRPMLTTAIAIGSMLAVSCATGTSRDVEITSVSIAEVSPSAETATQSTHGTDEPVIEPTGDFDLDTLEGRTLYFEMCFEINPSWSVRFAPVAFDVINDPAVAHEVAERWWSAVEESGREDLCFHLQQAFDEVQSR